MKNFAVALFLFFFLFNETSGQSSQKFRIGLSVGAGFSHRILHEGNFAGVSSSSGIAEKGKLSQAIEIRVTRGIGGKLELHTGVGVSWLGYQTKKEGLRSGSCFAQQIVNPGFQCDDYLKYKYRYNFVNVPLHLRYFIKNEKWFLESGLVLSFLVKNERVRELKLEGELSEEKEAITFRIDETPFFFLGFDFGFGRRWPLRKNHFLSVRPSLRYFPQTIEYPFEVSLSLYAVDLNLGFEF